MDLIKLVPLAFLYISLLLLSVSTEWTLSRGSVKCNDTREVFWFRAENGTNFIHFLFGADHHIRPPAMIIMHSRYAESKISVDCAALNENDTFRGSVTANAVTASYGVVVYEVCEYVDAEDHVSVKLDTHCIEHFGSNVMWSAESISTDNPYEITATFRGIHSNDSHDVFVDGGAFILKFTVFSSDSQSANDVYYNVPGGLGVAVTFAVDRLKVINARSRVAPMLLVFSNQSLEDDDDFVQIDAYPRGISGGPLGKLSSSYLLLDQRVKYAALPSSDSPSAFAQFTPVSWASPDRRDSSSIRRASLGPRGVYKHHGRGAHKISYSLVYAYYKDRFNQPHQGSHEGYVGLRAQFVNVGSPKDGFYRASNYTSWTMVLSLGYPALEFNSYPRAKAALISIGVLTAMGAVGGSVFWYRRRQRRYQIFRFESLSQSAPSLQAEPTGPTMESLEPFQQRKLRLPFGLGNRTRGSGDHGTSSSRQPLLPYPQERPPDYHSVVSADL